MLNMIWAGMILSATAVGLLSGQGAALSSAIFDGCSKALELSLTLLGVAAFWNGLMAIAQESGCLLHFSKCLRPVIRFLFPGVRIVRTAGIFLISAADRLRKSCIFCEVRNFFAYRL